MKNSKISYKPDISTIILLIIMFIIPITFFYLLSIKTVQLSPGEENPYSFGFPEILFSIAFAFIATAFLLWVKSFMKTSTYLGLIIGLIVLGLFSYSVFFKFKGPYTTTFVIITSLIVLAYLGIYFFRYRKPESKIKFEEDFDDSL